MHLSDFDYELPDELIAQEPLADRADSQMLVVNRACRTFEDHRFRELPALLRPSDLLVLNNTKVFPARLYGQSETGANIEIFLVREIETGLWEALARPAKRLKPGRKIEFAASVTGEVRDQLGEGRVIIAFDDAGSFDQNLESIGRTPLPPYIKRSRASTDADRARYQTVFARQRGAIAAPTAGLHFTPNILQNIKDQGIEICEVTLHVGYGTFEPVRAADLSKHSVLPENYEITEHAAGALNRARSERRRIVAVGTTTTRTLENAVSLHDRFVAERSSASLTITPGYKFRAVDALLTNFHLPKSSLLILVSTFAGHELIMEAYRHAVASRYRFYSYGDCMLIT